MSNALPVALLRPSCAVLNPSSSILITHQWNAVTLAFARRFCLQHSSSRPSLVSIVQSQKSSLPNPLCRSFSTFPRALAKVENPETPIPAKRPEPKKRAIRIGPLPGGEVDKRTIRTIFGPDVTQTEGNNVLRILQHRRTSGSLADYGVAHLGHRYSAVDNEHAVKALDWLRESFPVDEARAAEEWAEKEANRISYELWLADPENADSKYNDPARAWQDQQQEVEEAQREEGQKIGMLRVGPSEFERNIQRKRQERLEAQARKAEEKELKEKEDEAKIASGEWVRTPGGTQLMKPHQTTYVDVFGREQVSKRKEMMEHYRKKSESPFKNEEEMLKATTLVQRLYPMSAFVFAVCLLSFGFAHFYEPPAPEYRLWPDLSPTTATLAALVATNALFCMLWRVNPLWPIMTKYFMHVPGYPRAVQSVLNVFSHVQYEHLFANMMFLGLVGSVCHDLVGRGVFLGTYISAGAVGTLASLYWANLGRGSITAHSVGASAAIWGVSALYCLLTDQEKIKIPFMKDMEVGFFPKLLFAAFVVMEVLNASKKKTTMDHASHFGGMLTGVTVAGYLHATGFHERRKKIVGADGVQGRMGEESKTVDVGAIVQEEAKQVKEGIKSVVNKKD